jgi:chemotaxis receptor (MCP) glutamine deamidase CheD
MSNLHLKMAGGQEPMLDNVSLAKGRKNAKDAAEVVNRLTQKAGVDKEECAGRLCCM